MDEQLAVCQRGPYQTVPECQRSATDLSLYRDEETGECFLSVLPVKEVESLRLFLDRCSLEAFEADGRMVMTNLLFPNKPYTILSVYTESGSTRVRSLDIYEITGK